MLWRRILLLSSISFCGGPELAFGADDVVKTSLPGYANPKECKVADPRQCAMLLITKDPAAPFDGILMTIPKAAALQAKAEMTDERLKNEVLFQTKLAQNQADLDKQKAQIDIDSRDKRIKELEQQLASAGPSWYEKPIAVAAATAVLTISLGALAIRGAQELKK
jgi:hypothetical protein